MEPRDLEYDDVRDRCADCSHELSADSERCCSIGEELRLCWDCALRRGGSYDGDRDCWVELPDTADLEAGRSQPPT